MAFRLSEGKICFYLYNMHIFHLRMIYIINEKIYPSLYSMNCFTTPFKTSVFDQIFLMSYIYNLSDSKIQFVNQQKGIVFQYFVKLYWYWHFPLKLSNISNHLFIQNQNRKEIFMFPLSGKSISILRGLRAENSLLKVLQRGNV